MGFYNIREAGFTLTGGLTGIILFIISHIWDYDLFEKILSFLRKIEKYEVDETLICLFLFFTGICIDLIRMKKRKNRIIDIQKERLQAMQATMVTVQDIVGNALNGLQLIRIKIEYNDPITSEDIEIFNKIVKDTSEKIRRLRDMDSVTVKNVADGLVGLDV